MRQYRHFSAALYMSVDSVLAATEESLRERFNFFASYLPFDKLYIELQRDGLLADDRRIDLCVRAAKDRGLAVAGGLVTSLPERSGEGKRRPSGALCYTDQSSCEALEKWCVSLAERFDEIILDDYFFTNCTCESCRRARDAYNAAHGITEGGFRAWRGARMAEAAKRYVIDPIKRVNPNARVVLKLPNWLESMPDTGYDPDAHDTLFDAIYTGTETRDGALTDQHIPRYASYSLMSRFEALCPGKNGGGWIDVFDTRHIGQLLEQIDLTLLSGAKEIALFNFAGLYNTVCARAIGARLREIDDMLSFLGKPVGVPVYLPAGAHGEEHLHDLLGMNGLPLVLRPDFPLDAPVILLTAGAAEDPEIAGKLENFVAGGGRALVTAAFAERVMDTGLRRMTSLRFLGRRSRVTEYAVKKKSMLGPSGTVYASAPRAADYRVPEFSVNDTSPVIQGVVGEERCGLMLRDLYGSGDLMVWAPPERGADIALLPAAVLSRLRAECPAGGVSIECGGGVALLVFDNGAFVLYTFSDDAARPQDVYIHIRANVRALRLPFRGGAVIPPFTRGAGETVFALRAEVGQCMVCVMVRNDETKENI